MRIGLLLPSVYMADKYKNKIFAPKELFLNMANGLVDKGHNVYVYSSPGTRTKAHLIEGNPELINKDFISPKFRGLDRILKQKNAHLLSRTEYEMDLCVKAYQHGKENKIEIMHSYHGDTFMSHYVSKLTGLRTVYTIHDPKPRREHIENWRIRHFPKDRYIFISKSQRRDFGKLIRSIGVAYHGVDINKFSFGKEGQYLAFIGRYIEEKGVDKAIQAAKKAKILLKMIGDDAYRELPYYKNKIVPHLKKGVVEDSTFFGEADRSNFLKNAKALLFPIQWEEPFGMVMIEAMASGTPVVAYNRGSVSEIVQDGVTGFIIDPDNENRPGKGSWIIKKKGIEGLLDAIERIGEIDRRLCRKHIEENFTVERMVEGYERVYRGVLSAKS
ncbi:MAG: glycosyltransferase [Candidatus Levybacteria bacterium]|nr:glycosyltransferase [Candidatus Levybacteria bacterium]